MIRVLIGVVATLLVLGYLGAPLPHPANLDIGTIAAAVGQARGEVCR